MATSSSVPWAEPLAELVLEDFTPHYGQLADRFSDHDRWQKLRGIGSELWLDSGEIESVGRLWARQFSAVTTNNTLLNKEVRKGQYDALIQRVAALVRSRAGRKVQEGELILEVAFALNARHALRLVEAFDAYVSVEEHTDLAHDVDAAVQFAGRFHAICPQRFYVKIPFTPAGLLAARRCGEQGIPINMTLGFSARQNYLAARFARPRFVNVFLGRLNQFVADNELGDGCHIGEKAALASCRAVSELRSRLGLPTRQIAASMRSGQQVVDLAGIDVLTMPTAAAEEFLALPDPHIVDCRGEDYDIQLNDTVIVEQAGLDNLWDVPDVLAEACDELDRQELSDFGPADLIEVMHDHTLGDLLVNWPSTHVQLARREGKIPIIDSWLEGLAAGQFAIDAVMNLAGLTSFAVDQQEMDDRIRKVLGI